MADAGGAVHQFNNVLLSARGNVRARAPARSRARACVPRDS